MATSTDVSIIVVNYNTSDIVGDTIKSIVDTADGVTFDCLVVDNKSSDGGFSMVADQYKADSRFTFIENKENLGLAAMNIMVSETRGRYILTLDPDAILRAGALSALVTFLDSRADAGAATARLLNADGSAQPYYRQMMTPRSFFFMTTFGRVIDKYFLNLYNFNHYHYVGVDPSKLIEIEQPSVTCLMLRRDAIGSFIIDPDTPFYFTDVGLCKRIYDAGYKIFLIPDAVATHLKSTSFKKTKNSWRDREYDRSLKIYFKKYYSKSAVVMRLLIAIDRALRTVMVNLMGREPFR